MFLIMAVIMLSAQLCLSPSFLPTGVYGIRDLLISKSKWPIFRKLRNKKVLGNIMACKKQLGFRFKLIGKVSAMYSTMIND